MKRQLSNINCLDSFSLHLLSPQAILLARLHYAKRITYKQNDRNDVTVKKDAQFIT